MLYADDRETTAKKGVFVMQTVELAHGYSLEVGAAIQVRIEDIDFMFGSRLIGSDKDGRVLVSTDDAMDRLEGRLRPGMIVSTYYLADDIYGNLPDLGWNNLTQKFLHT